jgi:hypothetical protein
MNGSASGKVRTSNGDLTVAPLAVARLCTFMAAPGVMNDIRVLLKCSELNRFLEAMISISLLVAIRMGCQSKYFPFRQRCDACCLSLAALDSHRTSLWPRPQVCGDLNFVIDEVGDAHIVTRDSDEGEGQIDR